jgi:cell division protein FtsW (lipid II flippase)
LLLLLLIFGLQVAGYIAVYRAALLRGFEPTTVGAARDLALYLPLFAILFWLSRRMKFQGNWALYTTAILLFSLGALVQYRLYSDPEYNSRNKAEARAEKTQVLRLRYINEFYGPDKRQMMGLSTEPTQSELTPQLSRQSNITATSALTSSYTWIPIFAFLLMALAYWACVQDRYLDWVQRHSFIVVLLTLVPLFGAVLTSRAGKALGNMTPWEPSKIPFLLGFAGILTAYYRDLAKTYWGFPRAQAIVPLLVMALIPFFPFFVLQDFGQMLVFSGAYATLYLVAVRRWPQLLVFVGSIVIVIGVLVVGSLPSSVQ